LSVYLLRLRKIRRSRPGALVRVPPVGGPAPVPPPRAPARVRASTGPRRFAAGQRAGDWSPLPLQPGGSLLAPMGPARAPY